MREELIYNDEGGYGDSYTPLDPIELGEILGVIRGVDTGTESDNGESSNISHNDSENGGTGGDYALQRAIALELARRPTPPGENREGRLSRIRELYELLQRKIAHESPADSDSTPSTRQFTDAKELGALIDITEECNLDARAVRNALVEGFLDGKMIDRVINRDSFREITADSGELATYRVPEDVHRAVLKLGIYRGVEVLAWIDLHEQRRIFSRELEDGRQDIEDDPITIGVSVEGYGRSLHIPVIKSIKSSSECEIVFPDGSEIDDSTYNKPAILALARKVSAQEKNFRQGDFGQLLKKVHEAVALNPSVSSINELINAFLDDGEMTPAESAFNFLYANVVGFVEDTLNVADAGEKTVHVTGLLAGVPSNIHGNPQQLMYRLEMGDYEEDRRNGVRSRTFTLWGGIDPYVYGRNSDVLPRFRLIHNELGEVRIEKFYAGGTETRLATDEETPGFINDIESLDYSERALQRHVAFIEEENQPNHRDSI